MSKYCTLVKACETNSGCNREVKAMVSLHFNKALYPKPPAEPTLALRIVRVCLSLCCPIHATCFCPTLQSETCCEAERPFCGQRRRRDQPISQIVKHAFKDVRLEGGPVCRPCGEIEIACWAVCSHGFDKWSCSGHDQRRRVSVAGCFDNERI